MITIPTAARLLAVSSKQSRDQTSRPEADKNVAATAGRSLHRQGAGMKKPAPVSTAELQACLFSLSPAGQEYFHATRDRHWEAANSKTLGLKRPAKHTITALLSSEFFSRDQLYVVVERTIRSRDRAWRDWALDPLAQSLQPEGPTPIHLRFNGE
jgi:hypothetical protein